MKRLTAYSLGVCTYRGSAREPGYGQYRHLLVTLVDSDGEAVLLQLRPETAIKFRGDLNRMFQGRE